MERWELKALLNKMLKQVIVISNHLGSDTDKRIPEMNYVEEKLNTRPVLDATNTAVYKDFALLIMNVYGLDLGA